MPAITAVHQSTLDLTAHEPKAGDRHRLDARKIHSAATILLPLLEQGSRLEPNLLRQAMTEAFGASDNAGGWVWKQAYEACEAALILFLNKYLPAMQDGAASPRELLAMLAALAELIPTHTRRSEDSQLYQQFSTPLDLAFITAHAARISNTDTVLEPSAGTGMLAIHARNRGARLILNELSPPRAQLLSLLFPTTPVTTYNAENIDDYLPRTITPTVIVMNPPFSAKAHVGPGVRGTDITHIKSALNRLPAGGRLVAITGAACNPAHPAYADAFQAIAATSCILFSAPLAGKFFQPHGTSIETRFTVIDKITDDARPAYISDVMIETAGDLLALIDAQFPERAPLVLSSRQPAQHTLAALAPKRAPAARTKTQTPQPAPQIIAELHYEPRETPARSVSASTSLYESYALDSIRIPDAKPHPAKLVQSAAMASVRPPVPTYRPHLPKSVVDDGLLSDAQLESVVYAGEAHSRYLSGRWIINESFDALTPAATDDQTALQYRRGWYLGDGTGTGKGRQVAGVLLDNWLKGRRRALWISKNDELMEDAQRDWSALGREKLQIVSQSKFALGKPITLEEGILYTTYATLRSAGAAGKTSRLQQILDWVGRDFDGVIVFDEAHAMGNAAPGESARGKLAPSQQGLAGLRLQNALPHARILYVSATGATVVENLAYAARLGFWGSDDFPFTTRAEFIQAMHSGGIAAMEVLARDAKALGLYTSRSLSYEGVEVDILEHQLTDDQIRIYNAYADAFQIIHANLRDALDAANVTSGNHGTLNSRAKAAARSAFESNKQRFFNHLITAMKVPTLIKAMERDIAAGLSPVVQLVTTSEALMERRLALIPPSEWSDISVDITPREYVLDYLINAFPILLYETYLDDDGNMQSRPVTIDGQPVICREAERLRDDMVEKLAALPAVQSALDQIIHHFGTDTVAEITGRGRRIVKKQATGGHTVLAVENRSGSANLAETDAFMSGRKKLLIFSDAGGTGRSYHADLAAENQNRRVHYVLEPGWKADAAIQGLGRTNRTNQASAPICRPVATDVRGEKRFLSTIAKRLDSLGAITKGQRQTGGQGLFRPEDNLESPYARSALSAFYQQLIRGNIPECSLRQFEDATGLALLTEDGAILERLPPMHTFLNRLLALRIDLQNALFAHLETILEGMIETAIADGRYEIGLETIMAESLAIVSRHTIERHAGGAETLLFEVQRKTRTQPLTLDTALAMARESRATFVLNAQSQRAALLVTAPARTLEDGSVQRRYRVLRPLETDYLSETDLHLSAWKQCDLETFIRHWTEQLAAIPEFMTTRFHIVTGLLLPIWKRLPENHCRIYRFTADDGERVIGRPIETADLPRLGITPLFTEPREAYDHLMYGGEIALAGNLSLRRVTVMYAPRIELSGFDDVSLPGLKAMGITTEIIAYKLRAFIPIAETAHEILSRLFDRYPPVQPPGAAAA